MRLRGVLREIRTTHLSQECCKVRSLKDPQQGSVGTDVGGEPTQVCVQRIVVILACPAADWSGIWMNKRTVKVKGASAHPSSPVKGNPQIQAQSTQHSRIDSRLETHTLNAIHTLAWNPTNAHLMVSISDPSVHHRLSTQRQ